MGRLIDAYTLLPVDGEELETVERGGWIPCAERLPEKTGRYLVTCEKWGAWEVDWNIWNEGIGWLWEQGVSAWMPLPDPYKGEQT